MYLYKRIERIQSSILRKGSKLNALYNVECFIDLVEMKNDYDVVTIPLLSSAST